MQPSSIPQLRDLPVAEKSLLDRIAEQQAQDATRYMPTLTVKQFSDREKALYELKGMLVGPTKDDPIGIDYGVIPGTVKPTLYLAGAQKICAFFGYAPSYTSEDIEDWDGSEHGGEPLFYYKYTCTLMKDGKPVGQGSGSCNSWESKYRYRVSKRVCPACGVAALIEGKQWKPSDPPTWVCYEKKGGCKSKFPINDKRITDQAVGRVANPDFADIINTVQKMSQKRAYVAACLSATGASQYFTQDLEDMPPEALPAPPTAKQEREPDPARLGDTRTAQPVAEPQTAPGATKAKNEVQDDPALTKYLQRAAKGKEEAQAVYADLYEAIKRASDEATGKKAWSDATRSQPGPNSKPPSPSEVIRYMYKVWQGVAEPTLPLDAPPVDEFDQHMQETSK